MSKGNPISMRNSTPSGATLATSTLDPSWRDLVAELTSGTLQAVVSATQGGQSSKNSGGPRIRPREEKEDPGGVDAGSDGGDDGSFAGVGGSGSAGTSDAGTSSGSDAGTSSESTIVETTTTAGYSIGIPGVVTITGGTTVKTTSTVPAKK